jgi:hypothetical protein
MTINKSDPLFNEYISSLKWPVPLVNWLRQLISVVDQKLDILLDMDGAIPVVNSDGELVNSGLLAASVVSTSDTSVSDNAIVRMDGDDGVTIMGSLVTIDDDGGVNIPSGQTYNIDGSPHTHTISLALNDLTDVVITDAEQGDVLFRGAAGWVNTHPGVDGQVWTTHGDSADPSWESMVGPGGSDNHIQYNVGGVFSGKSTFTFDPDTNTFTAIGVTSLKADPSYAPSLYVSPSGRLAYGFTADVPTYSFSLVGTSGMSIGVERNTIGDAGSELSFFAGGAKSGATNANGGPLRLRAGHATGSGSSVVEIWTASAGAAGTTDHAATLKITIDGYGNVDIPSGCTYRINGVAHTHTDIDALTVGGYGAGALCLGTGWSFSTDTWVYVNTTSFKIVGTNKTSFFVPGTEIKLVQSSAWKYFYVVSSTYSTDTVVTVTGGSDFSLADSTITQPSYSYSCPPDFPVWFNHAETWAGFSTAPADGVSRFKVEGRQVIWNLFRGTAGTSNANNCTATLPITAKTLTGYLVGFKGISTDGGIVYDDGSRGYIITGGTVANFCRANSPTGWATSGDKNFVGLIFYEI